MLTLRAQLKALRRFLTERRALHGDNAWNLTRGGNVKATMLDVESVGQILRGESKLDLDYEINKADWPTFMMLTDPTNKKILLDLIEFHVHRSIVRKNDEIQRLVHERLQRELDKTARISNNEVVDAGGSAPVTGGHLKIGDMPGGYRLHADERGGELKRASTAGNPSRSSFVVGGTKKSEEKEGMKELKVQIMAPDF